MGINDKSGVTPHKSSSERLLQLEKDLYEMGQALTQTQMALNDIGDAVKSVLVQANSMKESLIINSSDINNFNKRLDGLTTVLIKKGVATEEEIRQLTVETTVATLVQQLEFMKKEGLVEEAEEVTQDSFIVVEELDKDGKILSPRIQFPVSSLNPNDLAKFVGKKAGEAVSFDDYSMRLLEIYAAKRQALPEPEEPQESAQQ